MTSKPFVAKYESDCPKCHQKILVGMMAVFPYKNAKQIEHELCPKPRAEGTPEPRPALGAQEPPIYTYHRRQSVGSHPNDWIEVGVSTKGVPISKEQRDAVDDVIRSRAPGGRA